MRSPSVPSIPPGRRDRGCEHSRCRAGDNPRSTRAATRFRALATARSVGARNEVVVMSQVLAFWRVPYSAGTARRLGYAVLAPVLAVAALVLTIAGRAD